MARASVADGKLRGCPTCGTPVEEAKLALRDFSWLNEALPGKVGAMDLDCVLSCARTNKTLILEMKPPKGFVSMGAKLTFKSFVQLGADVWVVFGPHEDGTVDISHVLKNGNLTSKYNLPLEVLADQVALWWEQAQTMEDDQ